MQYPYDSLPAFERAQAKGADAVKGDFRGSASGIGVVMHSSPIEWYESPSCFGQRVEEMTVEECTACKMAISDYTFVSAPALLAWADGLINVMLCVKDQKDIPLAVETVIGSGAEDRAFLELGVDNYLTLVVAAAIPRWEEVYYVIEVRSPADVEKLIGACGGPDGVTVCERAFLAEFVDWDNLDVWQDEEAREELINKVKGVGMRTFAATRANPVTATYGNHMEIYEKGFDVVYSYNVDNAVRARTDTNVERGISPP